jgi:hypothetical protein
MGSSKIESRKSKSISNKLNSWDETEVNKKNIIQKKRMSFFIG